MLTMSKKPIDFVGIEKKRKETLKITISSMAALFGVSRMTYYGWVKGKPIRDANDEAVRAMVRRLAFAVRKHNWSPEYAKAVGPKKSMELLQQLLASE